MWKICDTTITTASPYRNTDSKRKYHSIQNTYHFFKINRLKLLRKAKKVTIMSLCSNKSISIDKENNITAKIAFDKIVKTPSGNFQFFNNFLIVNFTSFYNFL